MKKKEILIYDDDPKAVHIWQQKLKGLPRVGLSFEINGIESSEFGDIVSGLEQRRRDARKRTLIEPEWNNRLDRVSILVIDYDLVNANNLSGEEIAYLTRCYSRCGLIIALNQFDKGFSGYDLSLKGHPESYADLNIGDPLLDSPGLWDEPWDGFRPWEWPLLPRALEKFERRIRSLRGKSDQPILDYLGFSKAIIESLPRTMLEFLTKSREPMKTTFVEFVESSGNGLLGKDKSYCDESLLRIAAARINHWLEFVVLPDQNILVDAPHLVSRYPSLLGENSGDINAWNKTASFDGYENLGIDPVIKNYRFKKIDWLSRPTWFWTGVSNCEKILEVANPWSGTWPEWVFCEDISRFMPREHARKFIADLTSPFVQRYAKDVDGVLYQPSLRFSL